MKIFVTGGAGFIGSHLVKRLIDSTNQITVFDNFSTGRKDHLPHGKNNLSVIRGDLLDEKVLVSAMKNHDMVYHLAANADVKKGLKRSDLDFKQETVATFHVLEAMRKQNVKMIVFPSSMTVYGDVFHNSVSETAGPCLPISLYGAGKLAGEGLISAYSHTFGIKGLIVRLANIIGPNLTHGVIYDLIAKLKNNPHVLPVLGDGNQTKPYLYIDDLLDAIEHVIGIRSNAVSIYTIGVEDQISVKDIVKIIISKMKLSNVTVNYERNAYGWKGDVPVFSLDITKLKQSGFRPRYTSKQAVEKTVDALLAHQ